MQNIEQTLEVDFNNIDKEGRVRVPRERHGDLFYGDVVRLRDSVEDMEMVAVLSGSTKRSLLFTFSTTRIEKLQSNIPSQYVSVSSSTKGCVPSQGVTGKRMSGITKKFMGTPCGVSD